MLTVSKLRAFDAEVMGEYHNEYFGEANAHRVTRWLAYFSEMSQEAQIRLENSAEGSERAERLAELLKMIDFARELFMEQVTAFFTRELPQWLHKQIDIEFHSDVALSFGMSFENLDPDGCVTDNFSEELATILTVARMRQAQRTGETINLGEVEAANRK